MYKSLSILTLCLSVMMSCNNKKPDNTTEPDSHAILSVEDETMSDDTSMYLLVGTYTAGESDGIYVYKFDTISGYSKYESMVEAINPSYLAISEDERLVYVVSETNDNKAAVNAFAFNKDKGSLSFLNSQLTGGADPCYLTISDDGKHVVTANYSGGSVTVFNTKDDGMLMPASQLISFTGKGADSARQTQPHLHCVMYSPDGNYLFANDLGTDKIHKFKVNSGDAGDYLQVENPPFVKVADGSGPRHLEFHPNGKYAYLINELSGAVIGFNYDSSNGNLSQFQSIQADTLNAQGSADIHISPDGRYLYVSNRLEADGLVIFSINKEDGMLVRIGYVETAVHPRNFVIAPNGKFLLVASRDDNMIQVYQINQATGLLENTYKDIELDMPVCLKFASLK